MQFPQYRKYKDDKSYFKITDELNFIEFKRTGEKWEEHRFEAKILPDRNYISDLLEADSNYWDVISKKDFEQFISDHGLQ